MSTKRVDAASERTDPISVAVVVAVAAAVAVSPRKRRLRAVTTGAETNFVARSSAVARADLMAKSTFSLRSEVLSPEMVSAMCTTWGEAISVGEVVG